MTISATDLKFIASERMIDNLSSVPGVGGGGAASQTIIVDGDENNVFPDVMPGDRTTGRQQFRQVYPTVLSDGADALYNAVAGLLARPSDDNVEVVAFTSPAGQDLSSQAAAAVGTKWTVGMTEAMNQGTPGGGGHAINCNPVLPKPAVGDLVRLRGYTASSTPQWAEYGLRVVTAVAGDLVTVDGDAFLPDTVYVYPAGPGAGTRVSAVSLLTAGVSAAADTVNVDKLWAAVQLPSASTLDTVGEPSGRKGTLPLYLPGDSVLIEHGSTPTTREAAVIEAVNYTTGDITFTAGLANAFNTGSKLTRPVPLGVLQAAANNVFSQQTWTRTFSDAVIGSSISSRYSGAIPMTNEGAVTDRWAIVFTSSTAFNLISERLGQIASYDTGDDFMPLNPLTNQPYFTLLASGWGTGWIPGNCVRFNTRAAGAPLQLLRLTKPSSPDGTDQATLFFRGDVDA